MSDSKKKEIDIHLKADEFGKFYSRYSCTWHALCLSPPFKDLSSKVRERCWERGLEEVDVRWNAMYLNKTRKTFIEHKSWTCNHYARHRFPTRRFRSPWATVGKRTFVSSRVRRRDEDPGRASNWLRNCLTYSRVLRNFCCRPELRLGIKWAKYLRCEHKDELTFFS